MAQQYGITDGWQWISGKQAEPKPDHPAGFRGTRTLKLAMKFDTFEAAHAYATQERLTKEGWLPTQLPALTNKAGTASTAKRKVA